MSQERLLKILLGPVISEKATRIADANGQIVFRVLPDATKPEIKSAVESLFDVKVKSVNMANVKGKVKRHGQRIGKRKDWKKAYVCLHEGQDINFSGVE
jgi:large subunit ribosomal protein L23